MPILFSQIIFVCIFLLSSVFVFGQGSKNELLSRADKYIEKAKKYYISGDYEASIKEYQFAGQIYRQANMGDKFGVCYNGVGHNYIDLTRYTEARQEFLRSLYQVEFYAKAHPKKHIDSSVIADAYQGLGRYYMNANVNFDSAFYYHQLALDIRLGIYGDNHPETAESYYFIGRCYGNLSKDVLGDDANPMEKQRNFLLKALKIQQQHLGEKHYKTADIYAALGDYYYVDSDYMQGAAYHQTALDIRQALFGDNHPKIAESYTGMATFYRAMHIFDQELKVLDDALKIQQERLGEKHKNVAQNYSLLGNRYGAMGDYEKAQEFYDKSLLIFKELQGEVSIEIAEIYHRKALCFHALGQRAKEYDYLKRALNMRKQIFGNQHFKVAESFAAFGDYHGEKGTVSGHDSLMYYYGKAIEIWQNQLGEEHYFIGKAYDRIAVSFRQIGNTEQELHYLNEALSAKQSPHNYKSIPSMDSRFTTDGADIEVGWKNKKILGYQLFDTYMNMAIFYERFKDYRLALVYCQNALATVSRSMNPQKMSLYDNPTLEELEHNIKWVEALQKKAHLLLCIYLEVSKNHKDLEEALKTYQHTLSLIDRLRTNFSSDRSKHLLTARSVPVYEGAIHALHVLYSLNQEEKYLKMAFEIVERSKAFVLLQEYRDEQAKSIAEVPTELIVQLERLQRSIAYYGHAKNQEGESGEAAKLSYFRCKREYDSLVNILDTEYPEYKALKQETTVISLEEIQSEVLAGGDVLLEYFVGEKDIFVFRVGKYQNRFYRVPIPHDYTTVIAELRWALTQYSFISKNPGEAFKKFVNASHQFHKRFVRPFIEDMDEQTSRLILIPDGHLSYIPFEVLLENLPEDMETVNYWGLDLVIKRFEVNYSYSATLLSQNMFKGALSNNGICLGFAPSYKGTGAAEINAELPWAEKELRSIQAQFEGDYFFGNEAVKNNFLSKAESYGIIHLAMHGVVDMENALNSKLVFAKGKDLSNPNDFLYAYEVHNLRLNADLVVLSACETGFGKAVKGEGVLSLARAFMYAGTPSVVTTLWKVNDYTSARLMGLFYENLDKGYSKTQAMRMAKLAYLKTSDGLSGHPAFWASFITIGNPNPICGGTNWLLWGGGGILLLGLGVMRYRKRIKRVVIKEIRRQKMFTPDGEEVEVIIEEESLSSSQDINNVPQNDKKNSDITGV